MVSKVEHCPVSGDEPVSDTRRVQVIVAVSHSIRILRFWDVGNERFHFVPVD